MKAKLASLIIWGMLPLFVSCKKPPIGKITSFTLRWVKSPRSGGKEFTFQITPEGKAIIIRDSYFPTQRSFEVDSSFAGELAELVKKHAIRKYKKRYKPFFRIMDGTMWSLDIQYSDGRSLSSGGENAYPDNYAEMCKDVELLFESKEPRKEQGSNAAAEERTD